MSTTVSQDPLGLHRRAVVVDAHVDTLLEIASKKRTLGERSSIGHVDIPRLAEGGVDVQVFAIYIEPEYKLERSSKRVLQLVDLLYSEFEKNSDRISVVRNYSEIANVVEKGKIAGLISIEGGEAIEGDLGVLRSLYRLGVRAMGLTWNQRNQLADGVWESRSKGGLTNLGVQVVEEMNRLGMVVDVSHLSEAGFYDVANTTKSPIVASHSNCMALCDHPRNLTDDQIRALAERGGVMGMNFAPMFVDKEKATLERVLDHIDHVNKLVGPNHVGLGSDFDGIEKTPIGLEDVTKIPGITEGLLYRGYSEDDILKILGGNFLGVFKSVIG